jgi:hypothetical protein
MQICGKISVTEKWVLKYIQQTPYMPTFETGIRRRSSVNASNDHPGQINLHFRTMDWGFRVFMLWRVFRDILKQSSQGCLSGNQLDFFENSVFIIVVLYPCKNVCFVWILMTFVLHYYKSYFLNDSWINEWLNLFCFMTCMIELLLM